MLMGFNHNNKLLSIIRIKSADIEYTDNVHIELVLQRKNYHSQEKYNCYSVIIVRSMYSLDPRKSFHLNSFFFLSINLVYCSILTRMLQLVVLA